MDLTWIKIWHFSKVVSPLLLMKKWKFTPFCFSAKQSKIKCSLTLQIEIQPFKTTKHGFKKVANFAFSKGVSPWFLSEIENFVPVQFFSKIVKNKVFCDLLDRKLANLDQKNIDFKKQKIGIFPKGLVYGFWSKIGNYVPAQYFSKLIQNKVFFQLVDRNLAI